MTTHPPLDLYLALNEQERAAPLGIRKHTVDPTPVQKRCTDAPRAGAQVHERLVLVQPLVNKVRRFTRDQSVGMPSPATENETEREITPSRIATILHPTDFSRHSAYAFQLACLLAEGYGARVVALHVAPVHRPAAIAYRGSESASPYLDAYHASLWSELWRLEAPDRNVRVEHRLEQGIVTTEILRVSREIGSDLIVMGTHGRTGLTRFPMGSVAEQIVRTATCPVVTIKTALPNAGPPSQAPLEELGKAMRVEDLWIDVGGEG
jgi:nucleotide-binding universal stress UspA family protein